MHPSHHPSTAASAPILAPMSTTRSGSTPGRVPTRARPDSTSSRSPDRLSVPHSHACESRRQIPRIQALSGSNWTTELSPAFAAGPPSIPQSSFVPRFLYVSRAPGAVSSPGGQNVPTGACHPPPGTLCAPVRRSTQAQGSAQRIPSSWLRQLLSPPSVFR
jgi:hypothetical protein